VSTTLIGNVVADPELKFLQSGSAICSFSVAVKKKRGEETYTSFFDCTAFGTMAENIGNSFKKGDRVVLTGELNQRSYETKDGQKRSAVELTIEAAGHDLRWQSSTVIKNES
jgi:single-strand DNA-binding protein